MSKDTKILLFFFVFIKLSSNRRKNSTGEKLRNQARSGFTPTGFSYLQFPFAVHFRNILTRCFYKYYCVVFNIHSVLYLFHSSLFSRSNTEFYTSSLHIYILSHIQQSLTHRNATLNFLRSNSNIISYVGKVRRLLSVNWNRVMKLNDLATSDVRENHVDTQLSSCENVTKLNWSRQLFTVFTIILL